MATLDPNILFRLQGPGGDPMGALQKGMNFGQNQQANTQKMAMNDQAMAAQKQDMEFQAKKQKADAFKDLAWSVTPQNYAQKRQQAIEMDPSLANQLPEQYDPNLDKQLKYSTLTAVEQLNQQNIQADNTRQDKSFGLQEKQFYADQARKKEGLGLEYAKLGVNRDEHEWLKKKTVADQAARERELSQGDRRLDQQAEAMRQEREMKLAEMESKLSGKGAAKEKAEAQKKLGANLVVQDIGRSLEIIEKNPSAAGTKDFGLLSKVPGSPSQKLDSMLDSVRANIGFDKLQAMREASPTGGALGNVSEKETAMLQATAGKLSSYMPEDQLQDNLKRLANQYNDIVHGPGKGPERFQLSFDEQGRSTGAPQASGQASRPPMSFEEWKAAKKAGK